MKRVIIIILSIFIYINMFAQTKHLKYYEKNIFYSDLNEENRKDNIEYGREKGFTNILLLDKNTSIVYKDNINLNKQSFYKENVKLFSRKKHAFKQFFYKIEKDSVYFSDKKSQPYIKVDNAYLNKLYNLNESNKIVAEVIKELKPDWEIPVYNLFLEITGKEEIINGFLCKEALLQIYEDDKSIVWYTEEFDYSWSFDNCYSILPGTVIRVIEKDEIIFDLKEIKNNDLSEILFTKEQIRYLIKKL